MGIFVIRYFFKVYVCVRLIDGMIINLSSKEKSDSYKMKFDRVFFLEVWIDMYRISM